MAFVLLSTADVSVVEGEDAVYDINFQAYPRVQESERVSPISPGQSGAVCVRISMKVRLIKSKIVKPENLLNNT